MSVVNFDQKVRQIIAKVKSEEVEKKQRKSTVDCCNKKKSMFRPLYGCSSGWYKGSKACKAHKEKFQFPKKSKSIIITIVVMFILAVVVYFGYKWYTINQMIKQLMRELRSSGL